MFEYGVWDTSICFEFRILPAFAFSLLLMIFGELDRKGGSFAQLTLEMDLSVMKLDDLLDQG